MKSFRRENPKPVSFNSRSDEFPSLSNFYSGRFVVYFDSDPVMFRTAEAAFQAHKVYPYTREVIDRLRGMGRGSEIRKIGRSLPLRPDWEEVKVDIMREVVIAKFLASSWDSRPRLELAATGDRPLIHEAPWDPFWGTGRGGAGANMLGEILEEVRFTLLNP